MTDNRQMATGNIQPPAITGEFITHSAEESFELACSIGEKLDSSAVFLLSGDLGAGKTVFAKGIAAGLDIDPTEVNSPTFTMVNQHVGRMRLYHLDLYRIEGEADDLRELGLEEMLNEANSVVLIEWPERLGAYRIPHVFRVEISDLGADERKIDICYTE